MNENFPFQNHIIFQKYRVIKQIGEGAYSKVFSAENIINKHQVALKIQDKRIFFNQLQQEAYYLLLLKGFGIPNLISYGYYKNYNILVEELLGSTLELLFQNNNKKNFLKDVLMVGIQIIDRLVFIHSKNIIHLDIKPSNFLIGKQDKNVIYMIDFGFAKKFRSSRTGKHIKYAKAKNFKGNLKFSSVNTMEGISPCRRDDLESLGYMLIYLYKKQLPWENLSFKSKEEISQKIYERKKLITMKELCKDMPKEMTEFMNYIKSLKFEEEPKYFYLKELLNIMLNKMKQSNNLDFSWIKKDRFKKIKMSGPLSPFQSKRKVSPFLKIFNKIKQKASNPSDESKTEINLNLNLNKLLINGIKSERISSYLDKNKLTQSPIFGNNKGTKIYEKERKTNKKENPKSLLLKPQFNQTLNNMKKRQIKQKNNENKKNLNNKYITVNSRINENKLVKRKKIMTNCIIDPFISNNIINTFSNNGCKNYFTLGNSFNSPNSLIVNNTTFNFGFNNNEIKHNKKTIENNSGNIKCFLTEYKRLQTLINNRQSKSQINSKTYIKVNKQLPKLALFKNIKYKRIVKDTFK